MEQEEILDESIIDQPVQYPYAGFWLRFVAAIIDGLIISLPFQLLSYAFMDSPAFVIVLWPLTIVAQWLYFAIMESSERMATIGKSVLGLRVTDMQGRRIGFGQATGRYFGKILSGITFLIGYIMAAFTEKKQALHDLIANTLVVRTN